MASEFVGTSITSQAWSYEQMLKLLPDNPHIRFADNRKRGYLRMDLTMQHLSADLRGMDSVQTRDAACGTIATFVVEDGKAGPTKAGA